MEQKLIEDDGTTKIVNHVKARIAEKDATIAALRAENAKLREALQMTEIALQYVNMDGEYNDKSTVTSAQILARRALESSNA